MDYPGNQLLALADILKPKTDESDEDEPITGAASLGPGSIGPTNQVIVPTDSSTKTKANEKDIWDVEEVAEGAEYEDLSDPRKQPEYDIIFQQDVNTEDIFLQMGQKNPTTASCPYLKIKINLPDTKYADVELNVTDKFLDCRSPEYKLGLHLPHPVDSKNGKAEWDGDKELLTVVLRMNREYDFLNS
ncbi:Protein PIH1D3 [Holothuria leucospilota]|uniref:Protein PIH1D3 n=1 Tax=Holothuria leucospilota TaxID=206669 RepID=A0A9Q1H0B1_HOLLE|nr:Protein PIH1D3 [Holothuria leucospilota]